MFSRYDDDRLTADAVWVSYLDRPIPVDLLTTVFKILNSHLF